MHDSKSMVPKTFMVTSSKSTTYKTSLSTAYEEKRRSMIYLLKNGVGYPTLDPCLESEMHKLSWRNRGEYLYSSMRIIYLNT